MESLIAGFGDNSNLTGELVGLGTKDNPWRFREIGINEDVFGGSAPWHTFGIAQGSNPDDLIVSVTQNGEDHLFRAHRNGQVVIAFSMDTTTHMPTPIPAPVAQKELNAEFRFWDQNADRTTNWYACMAQMAGTNSVTPQRKTEACTSLIQSGKEPPYNASMAYVNRSISYEGKNNKQKLADLNQAAKIDPSNSDAWAYLCETYNWAKRDKKDALQDCQKAVELNPKLAEGWTYRGDIDLDMKKYDLAIANYDQAIKLNPTWMWPLDNRGEAYLRLGQFDRALEDFNAVIRVSPAYSMGYLDRGILEMKENDLDAALADFQAGYKVQPDLGECLFGQGLLEYAKGDKARGEANMAKGRKRVPKAAKDFEDDGIHVP